jgi:hypothetical protein
MMRKKELLTEGERSKRIGRPKAQKNEGKDSWICQTDPMSESENEKSKISKHQQEVSPKRK